MKLTEEEIKIIRKEISFEFSESLRKYNISRILLAKKANISKYQIQSIEYGLRNYRINTFIKAIYTLNSLIRIKPSLKKLDKMYSIVRKFSNNDIAETIETIVSRQTGLSKDYLKSKTQKREPVIARYICYKLEREFTGFSFAEIGRRFNDADHASIMHGIKEADNLIDTKNNLISGYFICKEIVEKRFKSKDNEEDIPQQEQQCPVGATGQGQTIHI